MNDTLLRQTGIQRRMHCSGAMAARIEDVFVTVEQLLEAIESDQPLTEYDGVGPATAETIEEWYENRYEREREMPDSTVTERSVNSATIALHTSWTDVLGMEDANAE